MDSEEKNLKKILIIFGVMFVLFIGTFIYMGFQRYVTITEFCNSNYEIYTDDSFRCYHLDDSLTRVYGGNIYYSDLKNTQESKK